MTPDRLRQGGRVAALAAFFLWGVLPAYWQPLTASGPWLVVAHRILGSAVLLTPWMLGLLRHPDHPLARRRLVGSHLLSAVLLAANWFLFILATMSGRVLESALGYFLGPLISVVLGGRFLGEKLGPGQKAGVGLAAAGVALQIPAVGSFPWIAISLAASFAWYGFCRKRSPLGSMDGLALESFLMAPVAVLGVFSAPGLGFAGLDPLRAVLLGGAGLATTLPLALFGIAARRLPLTELGMLQYLGPSLQFLIGWLVLHEPLPMLRLAAFALIWVGVASFYLPWSKSAPTP